MGLGSYYSFLVRMTTVLELFVAILSALVPVGRFSDEDLTELEFREWRRMQSLGKFLSSVGVGAGAVVSKFVDIDVLALVRAVLGAVFDESACASEGELRKYVNEAPVNKIQRDVYYLSISNKRPYFNFDLCFSAKTSLILSRGLYLFYLIELVSQMMPVVFEPTMLLFYLLKSRSFVLDFYAECIDKESDQLCSGLLRYVLIPRSSNDYKSIECKIYGFHAKACEVISDAKCAAMAKLKVVDRADHASLLEINTTFACESVKALLQQLADGASFMSALARASASASASADYA